ncbi:MAG: hypothetical protein AB7G23_21385 [Vicinamibacterales bacterium]
MDRAVSKVYDSRVGDAKFRLTKYKGQTIGVELWPANGDREVGQEYIVFRFAYEPPRRLRDRLAFWRREAPDEG